MSRSAQINEVDSIASVHKVTFYRCLQAKLPALRRVRVIALGRLRIAAMDLSLVALMYQNQAHTHCREALAAHDVTAMRTSPLVVSDKIIQ